MKKLISSAENDLKNVKNTKNAEFIEVLTKSYKKLSDLENKIQELESSFLFSFFL
jgi:hypothetical protein